MLRNIEHVQDTQKLQRLFDCLDEDGNDAGAEARPWRPQENGIHEWVEILHRFTPPGALVADFTCGTAVSALAAIRLNRRIIINDCDANVVKAAKDRIAFYDRWFTDTYGQQVRSYSCTQSRKHPTVSFHFTYPHTGDRSNAPSG